MTPTSSDHSTPHEVIVGIDLGTTNSLIAVVDAGGPRVIPDATGAALVPSIVGFRPKAAPLVGNAAGASAESNASSTIRSVKRLMGRRADEVLAETARVSYRVVAGPRGMACVAPFASETSSPADHASGERSSGDGTVVTPEEVSAAILRALKSQAEAALGHSIAKAVITVPAYFDDAQRQATRDAGRLAGLKVVRIVNEPTAAALAYGIGSTGRIAQTIAVYDLGGGTFDVSILQVIPRESEAAASSTGGGAEATTSDFFQVLATAGDTALGGDDFDAAIVLLLEAKLAARGDGAFEGRRGAVDRERLRRAAEQAKRLLTDGDVASIALGPEFAGAGHRESASLTLTRGEFESAIAALVERTISRCRQALRDAKLTVAEIDQVVMVGGSSRVPLVRRSVAELFGKSPYVALDPDQVVALGAAVQGSILSGAIRDTLLLDVVPLSLGIETVGGAMAKLIVRNTSVPARAIEMFSTSVDGQTSVKIHVLQGERELVGDSRSLGEFHLRGIPPMPAGIPQVAVEFLVDSNGILNVSARERRSGTQASIQIVPSRGLTREEVDRMERESLDHARSDMRVHRVIDLSVNAALDVKWIGEALARVRSELEPAYAVLVDARLAEVASLIEAARRDPSAVDAEAFHGAKQSLDELSMRVHEVSIARSLREGAAGERPDQG